MAVTEETSGTQSATINTEHTLATITTDGVFQFVVDLTNLADGDKLELRAKVKVLSGGGSVLEDLIVLEHGQSNKVFRDIARMSIHEIVYTLKQTAGTGRSFPWSVLKAA
jgi:hypothetical protein